MCAFRINSSVTNLVNICVDEMKDGEVSGRVYHRYSDCYIEFQEMRQVLNIMDNLYDDLGYPQASTENRRFTKKETPCMKKDKVKLAADAEEVLNKTGEKATFIVHVQYRQNSTWQGDVSWVETQQTSRFRSALELLKLIDSALDSRDAASEDFLED